MPEWFALSLVILGCLVLPMIPTVMASLWERRLARPYEPLTAPPRKPVEETETDPSPWAAPRATEEPLAAVPYALKVNDTLRRMDFLDRGSHRDAKGKMYRIRYDFWLSPDRRVLAIVGGGTLAGIAVCGTVLHSKLDDDHWLITTDRQPAVEVDLSGFSDWALWTGIDTEELLGRHLDRVADSFSGAASLSATDPLGDLDAFNRRRLEHLGDRGLIRFLDPDHDAWKYTLKGAITFSGRAHLKGLADVGRNAGRSLLRTFRGRAYRPSESRDGTRDRF